MVAARPDLIVDAGSTLPTFVELADRAQQQTGIAYALLDGRFDAIPASYTMLGELMGRQARARELAQQRLRVHLGAAPHERHLGGDHADAQG